ncbi:MAG: hypothetical protein G8345_06210, partial [Magnetococcales bacterium]|nr:hypothetical protein [Magnetococcales bacterium]
NLVHSQTVGAKMQTGQTGVFQLGDTTDLAGDIYTTFIDQLVVDVNDSNYNGVPPDMDHVQNGTLTIAYGPDPDNLSVDSININPATMTIEDVRAALDASPAFSAVYDSNRVKLTAQDTYYGVVSDTSGIMAALGIGAIFGGRNAMEMSTNQEMIADNRMVGIGHIVQADDGTYQFDDGNNQGALAMSNLRSMRVDPFSTGDNATFASHYGQIVGELGSLIMQDKNSTTSLEIQQEFITGVRESVSGVSLEEELTDLIKFQRAFQASGKMVGAADELMQSVLQML